MSGLVDPGTVVASCAELLFSSYTQEKISGEKQLWMQQEDKNNWKYNNEIVVAGDIHMYAMMFPLFDIFSVL